MSNLDTLQGSPVRRGSYPSVVIFLGAKHGVHWRGGRAWSAWTGLRWSPGPMNSFFKSYIMIKLTLLLESYLLSSEIVYCKIHPGQWSISLSLELGGAGSKWPDQAGQGTDFPLPGGACKACLEDAKTQPFSSKESDVNWLECFPFLSQPRKCSKGDIVCEGLREPNDIAFCPILAIVAM